MSRFAGLLNRRGARKSAQLGGDAAVQLEPPEIIGGVVDTYRIPSNARPDAAAQVFVVEEDGYGRYHVRLPALSADEKGALELLKANLLNSIPVGASGSPHDVVEEYLRKTAREADLFPVIEESHAKLLYMLLKDFSGFWEVDQGACSASRARSRPTRSSRGPSQGSSRTSSTRSSERGLSGGPYRRRRDPTSETSGLRPRYRLPRWLSGLLG